MDNNIIPEKFELNMDEQTIKVAVHHNNQQVIFMVEFPGEIERVAISFEVDHDGSENWLENGILSDRAEEIGRVLEAKFS